MVDLLETDDEMLSIEKEYPEIDDARFFEISRSVHKHTLTNVAAQWALYKGIEYILRNEIPGDIVECGVWNGGSILLAARALLHFGDTSRSLYLFDTFSGMPEPDDIDVDWAGNSALAQWHSSEALGTKWGYGGTEDMVREVVMTSGYPEERFVFVKGMVEDTLPDRLPAAISIFRLDTDLYHSTYHELVHGYPVLSAGGILIIDDYGYFKGSRIATDKYFSDNRLPVFLTRINSSVHLAVKR